MNTDFHILFESQLNASLSHTATHFNLTKNIAFEYNTSSSLLL